MKWLRKFFSRECEHEFNISDIKQLNRPAPTKPSTSGCAEWEVYFRELNSFRKLDHVSCVCRKCGEEFKAHHGIQLIRKGKLTNEGPST